MTKIIDIARGEIGQEEIKGGENPRILEYFTATSYHAKEDEIPWCAAFVNWVLMQAGIPRTGSAAAKSFIDWGVPLDTPEEGCVAVCQQKQLKKNSMTASGYHVAFWLQTDGEYDVLLGGNQSDQVKISKFKHDSYNWWFRRPEDAG
jgi:uncharacterized protein (TIGR02594 family)